MKIIKRIFLFIIGIAIIIITLSSFLVLSEGRVPYSISVSAYTRSDGTHVNSYQRRPNGTASYDDFLFGMQVLSVGGFIFGIYIISSSIKKDELQIASDFFKNAYNSSTIVELTKCLKNGNDISFNYINKNGITEKRLVKPKEIVYKSFSKYKNKSYYLVAFDYKSKKERYFQETKISEICEISKI